MALGDANGIVVYWRLQTAAQGSFVRTTGRSRCKQSSWSWHYSLATNVLVCEEYGSKTAAKPSQG